MVISMTSDSESDGSSTVSKARTASSMSSVTGPTKEAPSAIRKPEVRLVRDLTELYTETVAAKIWRVAQELLEKDVSPHPLRSRWDSSDAAHECPGQRLISSSPEHTSRISRIRPQRRPISRPLHYEARSILDMRLLPGLAVLHTRTMRALPQIYITSTINSPDRSAARTSGPVSSVVQPAASDGQAHQYTRPRLHHTARLALGLGVDGQHG